MLLNAVRTSITPDSDEIRFIRWSTAVAGAVLLVMLLGMCSAHADEAGFLYETGFSFHQKPKDGIYWQKRHPHDLDMNQPYLRIGYGFAITNRTELRVSGFYLGKWQIESMDTRFDPDYDANSPTGCAGPCPPLVHWSVSSAVSGIALTAKVTLVKNLNLSVEAGPTINYFRTSMRVLDENYVPINGYTVKNQRELDTGLLYAVSLRTKNLSIGVARYLTTADWTDRRYIERKMPSGVDAATVVFVGYEFGGNR